MLKQFSPESFCSLPPPPPLALRPTCSPASQPSPRKRPLTHRRLRALWQWPPRRPLQQRRIWRSFRPPASVGQTVPWSQRPRRRYQRKSDLQLQQAVLPTRYQRKSDLKLHQAVPPTWYQLKLDLHQRWRFRQRHPTQKCISNLLRLQRRYRRKSDLHRHRPTIPTRACHARPTSPTRA